MESGNIKGLIKQMDEKYSRIGIVELAWSSKIDLIAVSNVLGEVSIHRIHWQRIWYLPQLNKDTKVVSIVWRPDGRSLAVAYSNREIWILNVDRKQVIHKFMVKHDVCYMRWTEERTENRREDYKNMMSGTDCLIQLNEFTGNDGNTIQNSRFEKVTKQNCLNFLLIALQSGDVDIKVFGILTYGVVHMKPHLPKTATWKILFVDITANLENLFVVVDLNENKTRDIRCFILHMAHVPRRAEGMYMLTCRYSTILSMLDYVDYCIQSVLESWESIVVNEMLLKLSEYAEKNPPESLSAEFLELLVFGIHSQNMDNFLTHQLPDKDLKRISSSIEANHRSIQKALLHHLKPAVESLLFETTVIRGLSRTVARVEENDENEKLIGAVLVTVSGFYIKINEMLSIIEDSMAKYRAFFKWLISVISNMGSNYTEDPQPALFTQREEAFITDFLYKIDRLSKTSSNTGSDELSQYLADSDLKIVQKGDIRWGKLLQENACLRNDVSIVPDEFARMSLIQIHKRTRNVVNDLFGNYHNYMTSNCNLTFQCTVFSSGADHIPKMIASVNDNELILALMKTQQEDALLEVIRVFKPALSPPSDQYEHGKVILSLKDVGGSAYKIMDAQFYKADVISLILNDNGANNSYYTQLPIRLIQPRFSAAEGEVTNVFSVIGNDFRVIEGMKVTKMAVSGARKSMIVLTDEGHRIRIYEMEVEDEDADMTLQSDATNESNKSADLTMSDNNSTPPCQPFHQQ